MIQKSFELKENYFLQSGNITLINNYRLLVTIKFFNSNFLQHLKAFILNSLVSLMFFIFSSLSQFYVDY